MRTIWKPILTIALTLLLLGVRFQPVMQVEAQSGTSNVCGATYTVQLGNTLTGIAQRCGVTYAALLAANPGITNPNLIFPAQIVNIPQGSIPTTGNPGSPGTYTVRSGDTLFRIALNNNLPLTSVLAANPGITNPNLIFPGQVINITGGSTGTPGGQIPDTGQRTYTVQPGDTLYNITNRFGTTVVNVMRINPQLTNMDIIYPGQVINLP